MKVSAFVTCSEANFFSVGKEVTSLYIVEKPDGDGDNDVSEDSVCAHLVVHDAVDPIASERSCVLLHSERLFRSM